MEAPVLTTQIANDELSIDSNVYILDVRTIQPHPDNNMFDTDPREEDELATSIATLGQLQTAIVNRRPDGSLRMVSGHRRRTALMRNNVYSMRCEIIEVSDDEELVMLFHNNLGRGLKEHYKIRFFKAVNQFLYQMKTDGEISSTYESDELANSLFVHSAQKLGLNTKGKRTWEVINMITGFSRREQETLRNICDERYREQVLSKIKNEKQRSKVRKSWEMMEEQALNGEIALSLMDSAVKDLQKKLEEKPSKPIKQVKVSLPTPTVEEKDLRFDQSFIDFMSANTNKLRKLHRQYDVPFNDNVMLFVNAVMSMYAEYNAALEG